MQPPTSRLPPIAKISSFPCNTLLDALSYLRGVYIPEVRGSRRRRLSETTGADGGGASIPTTIDCPTEHFRSDAFERSYAVRWLTTLISRVDSWTEDFEDKGLATFTDDIKSTARLKEQLLQEAASLLAICAGTAAAGTFTRVFTFTSRLLPATIQLQLMDAPLENDDFSSVGAQTWGGACVLAELIVDNPESFGLLSGGRDVQGEKLRVLELGAGTGLVSLVLGKLLGALPEWGPRQATILATDFHPSVLANLNSNVSSNFPILLPSSPSESTQVSIDTHVLDWSTFVGDERPPFDTPFDLILGADIIYEAEHAIWIKSCLEHLLRRNPPGKTSDSHYLFHLVIPLRATHMSESSSIEEVFPRVDSNAGRCTATGAAAELQILSKEIIICDAHGDSGRGGYRPEEDVEYAYYTIGWC